MQGSSAVAFAVGDVDGAITSAQAALEQCLLHESSMDREVLNAYLYLALYRTAADDVVGGHAAARKALLRIRSRSFEDALIGLTYTMGLVAVSRGRAKLAATWMSAVDGLFERVASDAPEYGGIPAMIVRGRLESALAELLSDAERTEYRAAGRSMTFEVLVAEALKL